MRDWLVILPIALAALATALWLLARLRSSRSAARPAGQESEEHPAVVAAAEPAENSDTTQASEPPNAVPNTKILPHPEDMPLATLEFDGTVGHVAIRRGDVVIGRHSTDDVRIPDVRVSRHHARLVALGDGLFEIQNLTAARPEPNRMLVNGVTRERARIDDGDIITLGGVSFTFRQAAA
ncbi:MAG: FHA domain-containing protein [Hyphomicrobiaceae bacterium]|nr:FHA domain-containing protein [Hyphomicrobiaceae bacterium]